MKYFKIYFLLKVLLLIGCTEEPKRHQPQENELAYSNEQEKLLNEAFLEIVGTDLCYTIEEKYLSMAQKAWDEKGEEVGRRIFDKYKIEDTSRVVIFIKDKFISKNDWPYFKQSGANKFSDADTLEPSYLPYIKQHLADNRFIRKNESARHILDSLSRPLKISSYNLKKTGCYKIVRLDDKEKIKGKFKTYGTFDFSRIYLDQANGRACFFYEKNCVGGTKCAAGTLVLLKKTGNKWKVLKELTIYQT